MKYVVDIDGTICSIRKDLDYIKCEPFKERISYLNTLFDSGDKVVLFTGRHEIKRNVTEEWLKLHNVKHHELLMDKPIGDKHLEVRYIDDLALHPEEFFEDK